MILISRLKEPLISKLNDDILLHIFENLDLKERINIEIGMIQMK